MNPAPHLLLPLISQFQINIMQRIYLISNLHPGRSRSFPVFCSYMNESVVSEHLLFLPPIHFHIIVAKTRTEFNRCRLMASLSNCCNPDCL